MRKWRRRVAHFGDRAARHAIQAKRKIMETLSWWDREFWAGLSFKFRRLATWLPGINDVIEEAGEEEGAGQVEEVMDVDEDDLSDV